MPAKLTTESYIAKCVAKMGNRWDYSKTEYFGNNKNLTVVCKEHGEFYPLANDHLSKMVGCPECAGVKKLTKEKFVERSNKVHNNKFSYEKSIYKNVDTKVEIICPVHGSFWQTPHGHMNGFGCDKCSGTYKSNTEEFVNKSKVEHGDTYSYEKVEYVDSVTEVVITCKTHGDFKQRPSQHLQGQGCPICGGVKPAQYWEVVRKCRNVHGDFYSYDKLDYTSKSTEVIITCLKHGDFSQLLYNHLSGRGCPKCGAIKSKAEDTLANLVSGYVRHQRILNGKDVDFLWSERNLGVEVNGVYHHSDYKKPDDYHFNKSVTANALGLKLLHFTDSQVYNKTDIVVSMINNSLGKSNRVYARRCDVREVTYRDYTKFFSDNHISDSVSAKHAYGLYQNGELVICMSFNAPRFDKEADWEIIRLATKLNTIVVGGASRLLKHFIKIHNPKMILSYSDNRYGDGGVYESLGFVYQRTTEPNYSYHHSKLAEVSRYRAQKHKLHKLLGARFDESKSERANMLACGYFRIFDSGHKVFTLTF